MHDDTMARCACGSVTLRASGTPIGVTVCYCRDCEEGWRRIEALPGAARAREADGGTAYQVYRKDRVRCVTGQQHLRPFKLREGSATNRVVASCCNTPMLVDFDDAKHWVSICRRRFGDAAAPLEMRMCTRTRRPGELAADLPNHTGYPPRFIGRLLLARLAMLVGR